MFSVVVVTPALTRAITTETRLVSQERRAGLNGSDKAGQLMQIVTLGDAVMYHRVVTLISLIAAAAAAENVTGELTLFPGVS